MSWIDIASIVFVCVTANHLGLIRELEEIMGELPIIDCPKCFTFWSVLGYGLFSCCGTATYGTVATVLAVSFLASYSAMWLELFEAFIDNLYLRLYDKITTTNTYDATSASSERSNSIGSMSELQ